MAIDGKIRSGKLFTLGIEEETVFGTNVASTMLELLVPQGSLTDIDYGGKIFDDSPTHDTKRMRDISDIFSQYAGGEFRLPFTCYATKITLDLLLKALFQIVAENASTPFQKDYFWDETVTQPDFVADAGSFWTVLLGSPISSDTVALTSCILDTLSLTMDLGSNGGRLMCSGTWYSGFAPTQDHASTSLTSAGTAFYHFSQMTSKKVATNDVVISGYNLTFNNFAKRVGFDANGDAETYAIGIPVYDMDGSSITLLYDANTKDIIDDFVTGTTKAIVLNTGSTGVDSALITTIANAEYTGVERDFSGDLGTFINLGFKAAQTGTTNAVDVEISNAVDRVW